MTAPTTPPPPDPTPPIKITGSGATFFPSASTAAPALVVHTGSNGGHPEPEPDERLAELDPELDAMQTLIDAMEELPPAAQRRVLIYLADRYL